MFISLRDKQQNVFDVEPTTNTPAPNNDDDDDDEDDDDVKGDDPPKGKE